MNLVLDEAEEVHMKTKNRKTLGILVFSLISDIGSGKNTMKLITAYIS
jgi:hypothetical protein